MKNLLLTLFPMALAAILVLVGGERLAKQEIEERTPIDDERLTDFLESFREEIERLESLYLGHLHTLTQQSLLESDDEVREEMQNIAGIKLIRHFHPQKNDTAIALDTQIPEVEMEGRKRPLIPETAFVLPESIFELPIAGAGDFLPEIKGEYRVFLSRPYQDTCVAILVDTSITGFREREHLETWLAELLIPIQGNEEFLAITQIDGSVLTSSGNIPDVLPSSYIPIRSSLGQWNIQTWDRVSTSNEYDAGILTTATILALVLLASGVFLFFQQKRALRLAASRVSFVNRVSHELGTPLTSIRLNLDLAQDHLMDQTPTSSRLRLVSEEVDRLARLVTNVLTFARHERNNLEINPALCQPGEIISQTLKTFRPALQRRSFEIESDIAEIPTSLIDGDALAQITGNLISNVEKYAASGSWLRVSCEQQEESLFLNVRDRGDGIPSSKKEHIFRSFARVRQDTSEGSSGTGLGLSIALDLAERMGGELLLQPSKSGAHFQLKIPCPPSLTILEKGEPAA